MLTEGPASGYDLKKEFESTFSHFFAAGYGSIYPALSSLSDSGYVDCEEIPQEGKPDRGGQRSVEAIALDEQRHGRKAGGGNKGRPAELRLRTPCFTKA